MAIPARVERATFSFGGCYGFSGLSLRNDSFHEFLASENSLQNVRELLTKLQSISNRLTDWCYAGATRTSELDDDADHDGDPPATGGE